MTEKPNDRVAFMRSQGVPQGLIDANVAAESAWFQWLLASEAVDRSLTVTGTRVIGGSVELVTEDGADTEALRAKARVLFQLAESARRRVREWVPDNE